MEALAAFARLGLFAPGGGWESLELDWVDCRFGGLASVSFGERGWSDWIAFCLRGVVEQARDTLLRCERLIDLNRQFHDQVNEMGGSIRLSRIVDELFITPVAIVTRTASILQVSYPTTRSDLRKLEKTGILRPIEQAPQISYICSAILQITYAD